MEDDMLKAQSKVVNILCNLKFIYPPAFFDIMIYLVIHLPLEALEGRSIRPWWMYPFERFMKKLKIYIQNKAKLEDIIDVDEDDDIIDDEDALPPNLADYDDKDLVNVDYDDDVAVVYSNEEED
ncbi:hypothetical protein Tco_0616543 [Tanacetum coccineum]